MSEKQELLNLLATYGLRPQIKWGQNFLLDKNLLDFIVRAAQVTAADLILEIGTGTGRLTAALAAENATIVAVEIDRGMAKITRELLANYPRFTLIETDILQNKNAIAPEVLAALQQKISAASPRAAPLNLKCVANLPYAAGTAFLANLFSNDLAWQSATCLLQYEVAARLQATVGSPHYGILAVKAALAGQVEILRRVPPDVFYPQPQVDSAIVQITFFPRATRQKIAAEKLDIGLRTIFGARRKTLGKCLRALATPEKLTAIFAELKIAPTERGENLPPTTLYELSMRL